MSSFLRLLLLLVIVTITTCVAENSAPPQDVNDLLSQADDETKETLNQLNAAVTEKLQELKETWKEVSDKVTDQKKDEEAKPERFNHWTTPPTIISPTPTTDKSSTLKPNEIIDPPKPTLIIETPTQLKPSEIIDPPKPSTPKPVVALPPPAAVFPIGQAPICGRRGSCYRWFKDELDLFLDGFTRCDTLSEFRARRYCCIDANLN